MRRGIVAVLCVSLLAVAVFVGGAASYTPGPPAAAREDGTYVALERTVCFGYCPAYRITIHDDGRVHYQGQHFVKVCGPRDYRVDTADVTKLFAAFKAADFFSLKDAYVARITDNPTYVIEAQFGDRYQRVVDYRGITVGMPQAVADLEAAVDRVAKTADLVGTPDSTDRCAVH